MQQPMLTVTVISKHNNVKNSTKAAADMASYLHGYDSPKVSQRGTGLPNKQYN